jgi:predicted transposase YbfD/YdcC
MPYPVLDTLLTRQGQVPPRDLFAALAAVPDPRRQASITYPVGAVLALVLAGLLANQPSLLAIADWAQRQPATLLARLGLPAGRIPRQSTLHRLVARLDPDALAAHLDAAIQERAPRVDPAGAGIAIDGKTQRGRLVFGRQGTPIHTVTAWCQATGRAVAHEPVQALAGSKAEAELTVAPALLARLDWTDRVLTGDALSCQRHLCQQVLDAGGDYLLLVKDNQPRLLADIRTLFDPDPSGTPPLPLLDRRTAVTIDRGHGRTFDRRELVASTDLTLYLDWPGVAQVFRLDRTWIERGRSHCQRHYGITSLAASSGPPERLLALKRGHWGIENRLHRVKDVTFGEDASLVHVGSGALVLAYLRDAAINLLTHAGIRQVTATLRRFSQEPEAAVALLLDSATHA